MTADVPLESWPDRLEQVIAEHCTLFTRIVVLRETNSTQDAARRMNGAAGDVFIAWRQTAGRGRLGRAWADTAHQGIALTAVIARQPSPERLAIASAVGVARAVESLLGRPVGIKWPNDIIVDRRKLAGILVEQVEDLALVGIGLNVAQTAWPDELQSRAVSLAQLGANVDRLGAIAALLPALDAAMRSNSEELTSEFASRDVLRGTHATFRSNGQTISGTVVRVDPLRGLAALTDRGEIWLPAATTSVLAQ